MLETLALLFSLLLFQCSGTKGPSAALDPQNFGDGLVIHSGFLKTDISTKSSVSKIYLSFDGAPFSQAFWIQNPLTIRLPSWRTASSHTIAIRGFSIQGELMMDQTITVRRGLNTDINGDGFSDLIVSAVSSDIAGSNRGIVYYYAGSEDGISTSPTSTISYPGSTNSANFGSSLAMAGDVNGDGFGDLIVGASGENKAYVFLGTPDGPSSSPIASLSYPEGDASPLFGYSVSSAGDVDGDGFDDVIISAQASNVTCNDCGAAYIYMGSSAGTSTTYARRLTYPGSNGGMAYFGNSVAGGGDVNGDGFADIVVGTPLDAGGGSNRGSAYVYYGASTGITNTVGKTLHHPGTDDDAFFGWSVSLSGDYNKDGFSDLVIGAKSADVDLVAADDKGRVYLYAGAASGIPSTVTTSISYPNSDSANFGSWVADAGDANGDGYADLAVGADQATINGISGSGGVFLFYGSASGLSTSPSTSLTYTGSDANGRMGYCIGNIGDSNADGYTDLAVGADSSDISGNNRGYAYVFKGSASGLTQSSRVDLAYPGTDDGASFGYAVH